MNGAPQKRHRWYRSPWLWVPIGAVLAVVVVFTLLPAGSRDVRVTPDELVQDARDGRITEIRVDGRYVEYELTGWDQTFEVELEEDQGVRSLLQEAGLAEDDFPPIEGSGESWWSRGLFGVFAFLPLILFAAVLFALLRWLWRKGSAVRSG
ncbi:MAG: hypothetical protein WD379_03810 [Dehalococcoidia bacterium]